MTIFDKDRDNEFLLSSKSSALPKLSLKYNPFPRSPSVVIDASNEILNGGLFNPNVRAAKVREFQEKFVDIDFSDPQHLQIGFLWSMSAGEAQKGFGKTALLVYYLRQINKNYGIDLLYKQQVAVTYARPESSTNSLKKLAALVCDSLLRRDPITQKAILTDAIRAIRFKVIQKEKLSPRTLIPLEEPDFETEAGFEQLTESSWVEKKWEMAGYHRVMRDYLVEAGLDEDVAEVLSQYHEKSTFKTSKLMQQKPTEFLFNHVVTLLQAAGFNGLYIFIDDLYVGASGMSERNKDTFADEVRYWFVEGSRSKAARENFFTTIMTFHPDLERSLANSWRKTRLNEMASFDINRSPGNNVVLDLLNKEDTIELLKAYTKPAIDDDELRAQNPLHPLTLETAQILMVNPPIRPGQLLKDAYELIEQAKKDDQRGPLTADYVRKFVDSRVGRDKTQDDSLADYLDEEFG